MEPTSVTPPDRPRSDWLTGGLAVLDERGQILSVNNPLAHWLGESPVELVGRDWLGVLARRSPEWETAIASWIRSEAEFRTQDLPGHPDQQIGRAHV